MLLRPIDYLGKLAIEKLETVGHFSIFFFNILKTAFTTRMKFKQTISQIEVIGVGSFPVIFLTGSCIGLVLALQTYIGFQRFGAEDLIGVVVSIGMARELGPIITGIMVTGRCGSSMAAEIGSMRVTEQIDALKTLCIDPFQYLIVPRIIASALVMPCLNIFAVICGISGGYLYCTYGLGVNPENYISSIRSYLEFEDITCGLIKSFFFGIIFSSIGLYNGYYASGGAQGIGQATTKTVVTGSIFILVADYILGSFLFKAGI